MISVVIPTHNRANLVGRAIKSVQEQSFNDLEIIIVSDGSTDNTKNVVSTYFENDKRIVYHEYFPARGGNVARNTGIELARGEYIAFLDDDDEWFPNKLDRQMEIIRSNHKIGLVYTGSKIIYVSENVVYNFCPYRSGDLSKNILLDNYIGSTSTVLVKKSILFSAGLFDINIKALQDYDLWIRICQVCEVGVVSEPMINYFNYTSLKNQVSAKTDKYIDSFKVINTKYADFFHTLNTELVKRKVVNENMLLANKCMRNGNKRESRIFIKKALSYKFTFESFIYYCLSFTNYKIILQLKRRISK